MKASERNVKTRIIFLRKKNKMAKEEKVRVNVCTQRIKFNRSGYASTRTLLYINNIDPV